MVRKKYEIVGKEVEKEPEIDELKPEEMQQGELELDSDAPMKLSYTEEEVLRDEPENAHMTRMEIRTRRAIYKEIKEKVKRMEKANTSKMIVFRDYRVPWFKAGGNSAVFYAFDVAGRMGKRQVNLNADKDGHATFHDGIVSFHGTTNLLENMKKAGYEKPRVINNGWILVFDLKHSYDKAELKAMKKASRERKRKLNELVLPENNYPQVYNDILALMKRIPPNIFKLNANQRQAFSQPTMEKLLELHSIYLDLANGRAKVLEAAKQMQEIVTWLTSLMKILLEARFWEMSVCAPIGQALADLANDIESQIVKPERKRRSEAGKAKADAKN